MASSLMVFVSYGGVYFVPLKGIPIGPESTERFGRGPDPDLARKVCFLNFHGHVGPLARAKDCRVDSVHTNFSRRSLPCHPEFLLLGRMSKSSPFDFDLGPTLDNLGPTLGRLCGDLGQEWAEFGPTLGRLAVTLGRLWGILG